jgi:hypothetical protein
MYLLSTKQASYPRSIVIIILFYSIPNMYIRARHQHPHPPSSTRFKKEGERGSDEVTLPNMLATALHGLPKPTNPRFQARGMKKSRSNFFLSSGI